MFGPKVPIDAKVLAKIDVTRGEMGGQIGLLRKEKLLVWPKPLKADTYETGRKQLTALFSDAVKQAKKGEVDAKLTETLDKTVGKMRERVDEQVANFSPDDYIEAARYLNNWPLAKLRVWHGGAESHLLHVRPRWATTRALSHAYTSTRSMAQASVVRRLSRRIARQASPMVVSFR